MRSSLKSTAFFALFPQLSSPTFNHTPQGRALYFMLAFRKPFCSDTGSHYSNGWIRFVETVTADRMRTGKSWILLSHPRLGSQPAGDKYERSVG
jgi:hypothetical protein